MAELNKDGLVAGQEVDFATLMKLSREHAKGVKHEQPAQPKPEPEASRPEKPSVSSASKAKEKKKA